MNDQAPDTDSTTDSAESLVAEAVDEFLKCTDRGERFEIEEFVEQYPTIADLLAICSTSSWK